jgi:hypothetical protein
MEWKWMKCCCCCPPVSPSPNPHHHHQHWPRLGRSFPPPPSPFCSFHCLAGCAQMTLVGTGARLRGWAAKKRKKENKPPPSIHKYREK